MFQIIKTKSNGKIAETSNSSWSSRLKKGLKETRSKFSKNLSNLFLGEKKIDSIISEELETLLLSADIGLETTEKIIQKLTEKIERKSLSNSKTVKDTLKNCLIEILKPCEKNFESSTALPYVMLIVGVNGAGKTTSIAKIAYYYQQQGKKIMLAAGDTFRAAAIEQLQAWAKQNRIPVIAQHLGADSASVIFDAFQAAKSKKIDILIADTAGRLHTKDPLMSELKKIKRVIKKQDSLAPQETMLVIDAGIGQNSLRQAEEFHHHLELTGITITKLDGTARGGMLFSIADKLQLPIRFIGVGESINDLKPFKAHSFVDALFEYD